MRTPSPSHSNRDAAGRGATTRKSFRETFGRRSAPDEFLGAPARVVAELSARALTGNYRAILEQVPDHSLLPMVKANGYGHGAGWAAEQLLHLPGLYGFGVATLQEGQQLREELGARGRRTRIIVFSGCAPWTDEKGEFCEQHHLTAVIATDQDWNRFLKGRWPERIPYELEFNTGMNRLGMNPAIAPQIARALKNLPADSHPSGVFAHLAISETPEAPLSRSQKERFIALRAEFSGAAPSAQFHLANSGGIWNQKHWGLRELTDVVRPGLSLYGVPPWPGAPERGIAPVMTLRASVLAVHRLKAGQSVGYGGAYKVTAANEPVGVAILGAGYADGVSRLLSDGGYAWLDGKESRFLGRVSMDLSAIRANPDTEVGDWAELLGPHVDPWAQAKAAQTIPYELLTSVSERVQRIYVD